MREAVSRLVELGPLPDEDADAERIDMYAHLLLSIERPVTDEEARALVGLFGPDEAYGLAWTMLHLIETAPGWPLQDCLESHENEWTRRLARGVENLHRLHSDGSARS